MVVQFSKIKFSISGDNIFIFNSASITLSGTGDIIDGQNVVGVKDANDIVMGQLQKLFSDDGRDVIDLTLLLMKRLMQMILQQFFIA